MKKCRVCKKKFEPSFSTTQVVCSPKCAIENAKNTSRENKKIISGAKKEITAQKRLPDLQQEVNKLSRMIDERFGYFCIDCGKPFTSQIDAAHYHSRGANNTLRFNLHNLHSARSHCNFYSNTHIAGYYDGLIQRYGEEYANYVKYELPKIYKTMKIGSFEVKEKLKIVRKLIRIFSTLSVDSGDQARELLNKTIGIYTVPFKLEKR